MSRIDRDGLLKVLDGWMPASMRPFLPAMADAILLLDQPAVGITLTPEEAHMLATAARHEARWNHENANPEERMGGEVVYYEAERRYLALAARLEASA